VRATIELPYVEAIFNIGSRLAGFFYHSLAPRPVGPESPAVIFSALAASFRRSFSMGVLGRAQGPRSLSSTQSSVLAYRRD
jgi:hypothetical protein